MHYFFAGSESRVYHQLLRACGVHNRLCSYFYIPKGDNCQFSFQRFLLDSGGFTARTRGQEISIKNYVEYINKNFIPYAFNLDTNDIEKSLEHQRILDFYTDAVILPIYHHDEYYHPKYRDLIDHYVENYRWIGIGGLVRSPLQPKEKLEVLDYVFSKTGDKVRVHGLGVTDIPLLLRYPWYSTDSSSWLGAARHGRFVGIKDAKEAFWRKRTKGYLENTKLEIAVFQKLEEYMTNLWKARGVIWEDL